MRTEKLTSSKTPSFDSPSTVSSGSDDGAEAAVVERRQAPPDHHPDEFLLVGFGGRLRPDVGAVADHRHAVGDGEDFLETMRDVDDRDAALLQPLDDGEQAVRLREGTATTVGSSITRMRAFWETALTISTICCRAVDSSRTGLGGVEVELQGSDRLAGFSVDKLPVLEAGPRRRFAPEDRCFRATVR